MDKDPMQRLTDLAEYWETLRAVYRQAVMAPHQPGAAFAADADRVNGRFGTLAQAVGLLNNALDSTDALATLWSTAKLHVPSDYILMRAIVDNAIHAIWLLDPDNPAERTMRAWRLARDAPTRAMKSAESMTKQDPSRPSAQTLRASARAAKIHLGELDDLFSTAIGPLPQGSVLVEAAEVIAVAERQPFHDGRDGGVSRLWKELSELVHGSEASVRYRMLHHPSDGHVLASHPDPADLGRAAGLVTLVLERGLELFYARLAWHVAEEPYA